MARNYFGPGERGAAVEDLQRSIGILPVDGIYGRLTRLAVCQLQRARGLTQSGLVDELTWLAAVGRPIPDLFSRCLAVTAAFEGHGFGKAAGNYDGAGLTWGIVGFTLRSGSLGRVLRRTAELDTAAIQRAFGPRSAELGHVIGLGERGRIDWANGISSGAGLEEPWATAFLTLGQDPSARQAQVETARGMYYKPAREAAFRMNIADELGVALCFDIQVQNGGVKPRIFDRIVRTKGPNIRRRRVLAELTAESARPEWRKDVLDRKLTLTLGTGTVHRRQYDLANWGLGEYPVVLDSGEPKSD